MAKPSTKHTTYKLNTSILHALNEFSRVSHIHKNFIVETALAVYLEEKGAYRPIVNDNPYNLPVILKQGNYFEGHKNVYYIDGVAQKSISDQDQENYDAEQRRLAEQLEQWPKGEVKGYTYTEGGVEYDENGTPVRFVDDVDDNAE